MNNPMYPWHILIFFALLGTMLATERAVAADLNAQQIKAEEFADEQWTLNRIYHCPELPGSDTIAQDDVSTCRPARFNAQLAMDIENEATHAAALPGRLQPASESGCRNAC